MFAINHAATALVISHAYPSLPLPLLLVSVQATELMWVGLTTIAIERITVKKPLRDIRDVHLSHMPYSHSLITHVLLAILVTIGFWLQWGIAAVGMGIGILSHIVLDFFTHGKDLTLTFSSTKKFGAGLYTSIPLAGFVFELTYGIVCWWFYQGSVYLLLAIIAYNLANLPFFLPVRFPLKDILGRSPRLISAFIGAQIIITMLVVWLLA